MDWRKRRADTADELTRVLRLDVRFYSRALTWFSVGHASGIIRGLATTFLMARWLPPVTLGQFRYALALFGVAGVFAMSGMNSAVIRAVSQGDTVVVWEAIRRILRVAPFGAIALLLAAGERAWSGDMVTAGALAVAACAFVPYSISGMYGVILTGQERIKELTRWTVTNNLLYAVAFFGILLWDQHLLTLTIAYFGFDLLFRGWLTWRTVHALPRRGQIGTHLQLGNQLSAMGVIQTIAGQLDQLLVQRFGGYQSLALYSIASVIPEQVKDFVNSLNGTLLQRMSRHKKTHGYLHAARRHFWMAFGGAAVLVTLYALIAPFVLPWLFPQYGAAPVLLSIVYMMGLLSIPSALGLYFLQAHNELPRLWRFYVTNTLLQCVSAVLLIPLFGSWGAVWAKTITRLGAFPLAYPRLRIPEEAADDKTVR